MRRGEEAAPRSAVARDAGYAASAGVARAVDPSGTAVDGDVVYCVATGRVRAEPLAVSAIAAEATAAAIRDGVRRAGSAPGCPGAIERRA